MSTPTRIRLNIDQKIKILEESKKTGFNKKSILKEYGISHPCLWKILNDKEKILKSYNGKKSKPKINLDSQESPIFTIKIYQNITI